MIVNIPNYIQCLSFTQLIPCLFYVVFTCFTLNYPHINLTRLSLQIKTDNCAVQRNMEQPNPMDRSNLVEQNLSAEEVHPSPLSSARLLCQVASRLQQVTDLQVLAQEQNMVVVVGGYKQLISSNSSHISLTILDKCCRNYNSAYRFVSYLLLLHMHQSNVHTNLHDPILFCENKKLKKKITEKGYLCFCQN